MEENISGNLDQFRNEVNMYSEIDAQIKDIDNRIKPFLDRKKELTKQRMDLKKDICIFMDSNNLEKCALKDRENVLIYKKRKIQVPITKDVVKAELRRFFIGYDRRAFYNMNAEEQSELIYDFIYNNEPEYKYSEVLQNKVKK